MQENNAENKIKNNLLKSFLVFLVIFTLSFSSIFIYKNFLNKTKADLSPNNSKELKNIEQNISEIEKPNENDIYKIKSENAKYTVVNYFSLDCIHCQRLWKFETQPENLNILKGEINLIYRPTSLFSQKLSGEKQLIGECLYKLSGNSRYLY
jgi:hypothetical protein